MASEGIFLGHLQCFEIEDKRKKEKQEKKNPINLSLVPNRQAALLVLRLCLCAAAAAAFMLGVTERGSCIHHLKGENRVSS